VLTDREIEVLKLRKKGLTQVEVAEQLDISQAAVSNFEKNAHKKIRDAQQTLNTADKLGVDIS
jgi:hypothetical protein